MRQSAVGEVNELLLATESGEVLEGSQTNFFAVIDGAVHTAGDGVLAGTVRRLLLEVSILRIERTGLPRNQQQQSARMMEVRRTPTETTTTSTMCSAIMPSTASMVD